MPSGDDLTDIESSFIEVAEALFAPRSVQGTLDRIVQLAVLAIEGCEAAGVLASQADGTPATLATSSSLAIAIHHLQLDAGEGPCLTAASSGSPIYANDLVDDSRWPEFTPGAVDAGIRTILAYPLSTEQPGALNLYANLPDAFGAHARAQAALFATLARLALGAAKERAFYGERGANLVEALRSRELIGQAQGILMERDRITSQQAFDVLRLASQHLNVKLRKSQRRSWKPASALSEVGRRTARRIDPYLTTPAPRSSLATSHC